MPRVLITYAKPEALAREVEGVLGEAIPWVADTSAGAPDADVWFCAGRPPDVPLTLPALRWIQSGWAGIDGWSGRAEWRSDVVLTRTVGDFPMRIAEYVFGYLLAWELGVPEALRQMDARAWERWTPGTLAGRRLLIVGYGAIGAEIGSVGRALGMRVEGVRRGPVSPESVAAGVHGAEALPERLQTAEFVINVLPHTAATESFWDRKRFAHLREGSTFVNVSRGATVDEQALLEGLAAGRPARALLDVFREEPLPASHPLRAAKGVWVTPHIAGIGTPRPLAEDFAENWRRYRAGLPLRNVVDRSRGY
jgi:phosphoglycerate dehydrogenase-like enzyme